MDIVGGETNANHCSEVFPERPSGSLGRSPFFGATVRPSPTKQEKAGN
jgi:hypothetical protein